jgi:pSer/pThr/pTyr-binding forkhead associated (FHA) protein
MHDITLQHRTGSRAPLCERFALDGAVELTLGRDPEAAVRFDAVRDPLVSRRHARITRVGMDGQRFLLHDLDARNGTFLNRRRIQGSVPLHPGDTIQLAAGGPELAFTLVPRATVG